MTRSEYLMAVALWARRRSLFIGLVVVPTIVAMLYLGLFAADQYSSEARFIVRSTSSSASVSGLSDLVSGGGVAGQAIGTMQGFSRAPDETYSVNEYMLSRDAVAQLEKQDGLREIFSRNEADFVHRFPNFYSKNNQENLYKHYLNYVDVTMQSESGISVLEVRAFRPEDARNLALALLKHAEDLVNKLNVRARGDAVRFAEVVVRGAEEKVKSTQDRITDFRNRELIVDPGKQSAAALDLVTRLSGEVAIDKAQLEHVLALTPASPTIGPLRTRLRSMEDQIDQQRRLIVGGDQSMAQKLSQFEQLSLERDLAVKMMTSALISLENARQDAQRQQLYLERIVEPNLSDLPLYPKRLLWVGIVFAISLCVFWMVREFRIAVLEHHP